MAPLTWRNVATPNMGDPVDALRLSGSLMDRGFTGLNESLSRFTNWQDDQNARLVGDAALRIQDPAELRRQLESGTLLSGMPGGSLTPAAMEALQGRAGTLLAQSQAQENLGFDQANNPTRLLQGRATLAGTEANTAQTRQRTAFDAQLQPGVVENQDLTLQRGRRDNEAGVTAQPFRLEGITREGQAARDAETAANVMRERQLDTGTVEGARAFVNSPEFAALSPGAQRAVQASLGQQYAGAFGPVATAVPGPGAAAVQATTPVAGAAGAAVAAAVADPVAAPTANPGRDPRLALPSPEGTHGTRNGSTYDVTYGNRSTPAPITTMPINDVLSLQGEYIRNHGNSPMGAYQINRDTLMDFAPRVLGENWRQQAFTPEVQDRIGRAIFEARRGGDLTNTWAALPRREAGGYANMSWEEVRGEISRREAGTTADRGATPTSRAANALREASDIGLQQDRLAGQNRGGSLVPRMREAANSTESAAEVRTRVQAAFPDEDSGRVGAELSRLVRDARGPDGNRLTYSEAGLIMMQGLSTRPGRAPATSRDGRSWWSRNAPGILGGEEDSRLPEISTFDKAANDALAARYASGSLATDERVGRDLQANQTLLANARARVEADRARAVALRAQIESRPQLRDELERAERNLDKSSETLAEVNARLRSARARVNEASGARPNVADPRNASQAIATAAAPEVIRDIERRVLPPPRPSVAPFGANGRTGVGTGAFLPPSPQALLEAEIRRRALARQ